MMLIMYMRLAAMEDQDAWRMQETSFELLLHSGGTTLVELHLHTAVSHGKCDNPKTHAIGFTQPRLHRIR
jgi:hypothetical protein